MKTQAAAARGPSPLWLAAAVLVLVMSAIVVITLRGQLP